MGIITIAILLFFISFIVFKYNEDIGTFFGIISIVVIIILCLVAGNVYANKSVELHRLTTQRDFIELRIKYGDGKFSTEEILNDIKEWNDEIIKCKKYTHNFWVGIFIDDFYDEFEPINYDDILTIKTSNNGCDKNENIETK